MPYPDLARLTALNPIPAITPASPAASWNTSSLAIPTPNPGAALIALQTVGIQTSEAFRLLTCLQRDHDTFYHAGKLLNGKAYLVSNNDQLFYGKPGQMKAIQVIQAYRTKCIGQQKRVLDAENGFTITIQAQNAQPVTAQAHQRYWRHLSLKIPHSRQAHLSNLSIEI
ncbi:hypothetical protein [Vampirovibrio sp.]|uniref:hypothetical protein n=1 Tax=Vampirovibrio sp. TaxID=2717857 RepID=UPI003593BA78